MPGSLDRNNRIDPPESFPAARPTAQGGVSDREIEAADGLVLVDPGRPDWQQVLWSAEIGGGMMTSLTMKIVEIPVDSRDGRQIDAVRQRVKSLKRDVGTR